MMASEAHAAGPAVSNILEAFEEGVYTIDLAGECLFINRAAVAALGYDRADELLGRNMHDVIHHTRADGTHFPRELCPLLQTGLGGRPVRLSNETLWRRDGSAFLAEYSAAPVMEDGAIVASLVTFRAVSLRREASLRLAVQFAVGQLLAGGLAGSGMVGVLETIGRGFGWDCGRFWRRGAAGLSLASEWQVTGVAALPSPGPVVQAWAERRAVHETGQTDSSTAWTGFAFPVGLGATAAGAIEFLSARALEADDNLLAATEVLGQMIGQALERSRISDALDRSESRFRVMADAIPQLSWMTGPDGSIRWYNQRWYDYTGTSFAEMEGWGWASVHHPDHLERVERGFRESIAAGEAWEDTFPLRAADGSYRWFLSRALPIRADPIPGKGGPGSDTPGEILSWFGSNTDITVMRDAERSQVAALAEAEAANLAKSLFLANMSHELRTPLSAIIGYSEMLIEEVEAGEQPTGLIGDVRKIESNARHLLGLINNVLDLSKVESGKMEAFAETFGLAELVGDVASTVTPLIEKNGNRLLLVLADDLGTMHTDVTRLRQMLLNLLGNAAKFTSGGVITLSAVREARAGGDWFRLAVADTGLGMTEEQLAGLFERFQQADISTTRRFGGTGLGLSLTKQFCALLGGDIEVSSVAGQGSVFTLLLPQALPEAAAAEVVAPALEGDRPLVLVIDDDATQRDLASRFLERTGFAAATASDGAAGLSLAREMRPHAILLDVTMPGMDGWSVLSRLKADPVTTDIPVVMVTLVDAAPLAEALGAADYLRKPVEWDRLRVVLERFREADGDILVVDDELDTRLRMRRSLEANGWSVSEAGDGHAALAHVAVSLPRVILLDLTMPGMDGFEFLRLLRERPGCGTVPVVVLTAMDLSLADRRRLRGASQVLNKGSVSLNELMERLRGIEGL